MLRISLQRSAQHDSAVYEMSFNRLGAFCPELFAFARQRNNAQPKFDMIKSAAVLCFALFLVTAVPAQNKYPGGIVYGPKAAFSISSPDGWVLDNEPGLEQGLPSVFYPTGGSWADAL